MTMAELHAGLQRYRDFIVADQDVSFAPPKTGVRITYLGTNAYLLQSRDAALLIDPYFSRVGLFRAALNLPVASSRELIRAILAGAQDRRRPGESRPFRSPARCSRGRGSHRCKADRFRHQHSTGTVGGSSIGKVRGCYCWREGLAARSHSEQPSRKARPPFWPCSLRWTTSPSAAARGRRLGLRRTPRILDRDRWAANLHCKRRQAKRRLARIARANRSGDPRSGASGRAKAIRPNFGTVASPICPCQPSGRLFSASLAGFRLRADDKFSRRYSRGPQGIKYIAAYPYRLFPPVDASLKAYLEKGAAWRDFDSNSSAKCC